MVINQAGKQPSRYTSDFISVQQRILMRNGWIHSFSTNIFQTRVVKGCKITEQCSGKSFLSVCLLHFWVPNLWSPMSSGQLILFSACSKIPYSLLTAIFFFAKNDSCSQLLSFLGAWQPLFFHAENKHDDITEATGPFGRMTTKHRL